MRGCWLPVLLLGLTACTTASPQIAVMNQTGSGSTTLRDLGPAPELTNTVWLNSDSPLRLADLRGKVVGIEMWTFDCVNCQHVMPVLENWYATYKDQGFVLIGNHYPEFDYERGLNALRQAVAQDGIKYPVAQDNDGQTWNAYQTMYWPTLYLIDKRGHLRYVYIGEGGYNQTEQYIRTLLAESYP